MKLEEGRKLAPKKKALAEEITESKERYELMKTRNVPGGTHILEVIFLH